jgi:hypothetical protein
MTVTLTYDVTNARVRITANGLAAANFATVERSTDQVRWTLVRNGTQVALTAGAFTSTLDDYEFADGKPNYYRVRGISTAPISFVAAGVAVSAAQGSLTPNMPAGVVAGDLVLLFASTRNSGTGTVNTPASWTGITAFGNTKLMGRIYDGVWTMPLVTYTGGAALEDTIVQSAAWRNADLAALTFSQVLNGSAQNIATQLANNATAGVLAIVAGWKQDDWTSVAALAGFTEIEEAISIAGNDAAQVWDYQIQTAAANVPATSFVVTGGAAAISRSITALFPKAAFLNEQLANVTPALDADWLKSPTRPFLNQRVTVVDPGDYGRTDRNGQSDVVGRTYAIATTDVRSGLSFPLTLLTQTANDAQSMDFLLAAGDVLFLHIRSTKDWAGGYLLVNAAPAHRKSPGRLERTFTLQCTQVAPPAPDVNYAIGTWATVLALYPSWAALLAANPTWNDLLALIASPSEVIVP